MTWVYIKSESRLFTVGFYNPGGDWISESDWTDHEDAAARVNFLNGGGRLTLNAPSLRPYFGK